MRILATTLCAAVALTLTPLPAASQSPAATPAAAPAAIATPAPIHAGALTAYRYGSGKRTLVLLPGLGCGAWLWNSTVAALRGKYTIYAVTFAGFDGTPPIKPPYLSAFAEGVRALIRSEKIDRPVLVGQSMGGDVALMAASADPASVAGVVAVDTLPINPPLQQGETLASRGTRPATASNPTFTQSAEDFAEATREATSMMVSNPAIAQAIAARSIASDRATFTGVASELGSTNLGPDLARIDVPVLVLAPVSGYATDAAAAFYKAQYPGVSKLTVRAIPNSRSFIMFDEPAAFFAALSAFVDGLP